MDHSKNYEFFQLPSSDLLTEGSVFCGTDVDGNPVQPEYTVEVIGDKSILIEGLVNSPWDRTQLNKIAATGILRIKRQRQNI